MTDTVRVSVNAPDCPATLVESPRYPALLATFLAVVVNRVLMGFVAPERLLTYRAAAQRMGITPKAFRKRVERGTVPSEILFTRDRGENRRDECFVRYEPFMAWCGGAVEDPKENT